MSERFSVGEWVKVPALITLVVTLLRVTGELMGWSPILFGRSAGGGAAIIGISWLIPILGFYFGYKLAATGHLSMGLGSSALWLLAALATMIVGFTIITLTVSLSVLGTVFSLIVTAAVLWVAHKSWGELVRVLTSYAYAARIPVAIVAFFAIMNSWGTHYELGPEGYVPNPNWFLEWVEIGGGPQLTGWICTTVIFGGFFGLLGALFGKKSAPSG